MALNLNKGSEENSKPTTEKKGLNLSKSGDSEMLKPDLTKGKTDVKKKSPALFIMIAVVLIGIGVFLVMNNKKITSVTPDSSENPISIGEELAAPSATSDDQQDMQPTETVDNTITGPNEQTTTTNSNNDVQVNNSENTSNSKPNTSNSTSDVNTTNTTTQLQGAIEEKAKQVISGAFGNGVDRKRALGSEYETIQAKVNEMYRNGEVR